MTLAFAVIPTHDRPAELRQTIATLGLPPHRVLVIDNASSPPVAEVPAVIVRDEEQPPNLSRLWNIGLDWAREQAAGEPYAVALLNDDLVLPPGFMAAMVAAMERTGAVIAYPDQFGLGEDWHNTVQGPIVPRQNRLSGYAFVLNGQAALRADERFRWWYGDDDLEWRAQALGGTVLVGGVTVEHLRPNASTTGNPVLHEQSKVDEQAFIAKWGRPAWERRS
ncbi:glycosyltransferase family 2 protein [Lentzea sp. NPDC051213]|uniref:glycosyltransferase family 2 protein n=1 Tax=Lentzea sp. NPDC051213 TaxID=3364126 RepID=UPI003787CC60